MKFILCGFLIVAVVTSSTSGLFLKKKLLLKSLLAGGLEGHGNGGYPNGGGYAPAYPGYYPAGGFQPAPVPAPVPIYPSPPVYSAPPPAYLPPQGGYAAPSSVSYSPPPAAPAAVHGGFTYSVSSVPAQAPPVAYAVASPVAQHHAPAVTYAVASPTFASSPDQGLSYGGGSQAVYGILLDNSISSLGGYPGGYPSYAIPHVPKC